MMEYKSAVTLSELFTILDLNKDGELSRSELHESARRLGWHWNEAPVFAVFDLLTVLQPVSRDNFIVYMTQIIEDPHGPFGKVLLNAPHFLSSTISQPIISSTQNLGDIHKRNKKQHGLGSNGETCNNLILLLKHIANLDVANTYQNFLKHMSIHPLKIPTDNAAVLIIDPQRSFTKGAWMQSIGFNAELEVKPIQLAFENCAQFFNENQRFVETMFTRCPFPPCSYDWDDTFTGIIDTRQLYFIKPGNSVLFPTTNGFREWVENVINDGKKILVIGGCTLNSCVRKSSIETQKYFKNRKLQIIVDLSLSGARTSRFIPSSLYGGLSAVESAIREMTGAGVRVTQCVQWI
jgi:hypothetical protein